MLKQEVIELVPMKVKKVLNYIDDIAEGSQKQNIVFNFYHSLVDSCDTCFFSISRGNICHQYNMEIASKYDSLFYSQLFISLLDHYLNNQYAQLSSIYYGDDDFSYSFYLYFKNNGNFNIKIKSTHNLGKVVEYFNERIHMQYDNYDLRTVGVKK